MVTLREAYIVRSHSLLNKSYGTIVSNDYETIGLAILHYEPVLLTASALANPVSVRHQAQE